MRRRATTTLSAAAAALTLVLGACGDGSEGGAGEALPKIRVGAGGAAASGDEMSSRMAADGDLAGRLEFVVGVDLPALDGPAPSWSFTLDEPDPARVAALAAALGVDGEVVARPEDHGGGWIVGPEDGSGPSVMVSAGAMGDWWYNPGPDAWPDTAVCGLAEPAVDPLVDPAVDPAEREEAAAREAEREAADGGGLDVDADAATSGPGVAPTTVVCPEPVPPTGVPSEAEARQRGQELLGALGVDLAGTEVEVQGDEWGRTVIAWVTLDGLRAPIGTSVGFGGDGVLTYANGFLGGVERGPDYPRAGTDTGVARLQEQWAGGRTSSFARDGVAVDLPAGGDLPATTVTITGVVASLWMVWNGPDDVAMVPAYTFTTDDGGEHSVVAVADEHLEVVAPEETTIDEPSEVPAVEPVAGFASTTVDAIVIAPDEVARLVGLAADEAAAVAEGRGWAFRVVERDGEGLATTDDLRADRVNVRVAAGVVVAAEVG